MDVDPNSLDPELRMSRFLAIASAALGIISLCAAIIPLFGGIISFLGIIAGMYSLRTENNKAAMAGVIISSLGLLITIVYFLFLLLFKQIG